MIPARPPDTRVVRLARVPDASTTRLATDPGAAIEGSPARRSPLAGPLTAVGAIAAATALGLVVFPYTTLAEITMLYLIAIMLASLAGRGPSVIAASLAVLAFDFCFVAPRFTFAVAEPHHLLTFAAMFAAGLVISSLTARLRHQERIVQQASARAHVEELRSSLLSAVSHDLRTPLAVITGAATTLRDEGSSLTPAARDDLLTSIVEDARRLERVLSNLLQLTRIESGLVPAREWIPVEELVGAALTRMEDALGDLRVVLDIPGDLLVSVDPVLFEQVLINLIDNAIKHGAPPFELRAGRTERTLTLTVSDHGPGIPESKRPFVFEKFARASTAPGTGLGLAVVRAIVEAHAGAVSIDGATPGGARVNVTLPAIELGARPAAAHETP